MKYRKRTWKKYFKKLAMDEHPGATVKLKRVTGGRWECAWELKDYFIHGCFWQQDFLERR